MRRHLTQFAVVCALVFCVLYVWAERRAQYHEKRQNMPRIATKPLILEASRDESLPRLAADEAYVLKLKYPSAVYYPHTRIDLRDETGKTIWRGYADVPDHQDGTFSVIVPSVLLKAGEPYYFYLAGVDGEEAYSVGVFDFVVKEGEPAP